MITRQLICIPFFRYKCGSRLRKSGKKVVTRKIKKRRICNDVSYYSYLPDEIVLLILNKIIDLKTLCRCKLVSKQFNLIAHQVDTISFVACRADNPASHDSNPSADDELPEKLLHFLSKPFNFTLRGLNEEHRAPVASYECESFRSAIQSLSKFTQLKSLSIELLSTRQDVVDNGSVLYKWKVKFGRKVESLVILSPSSNVDGNGVDEEQDDPDLCLKYENLAKDCLIFRLMRL
uniref:F-box protein At4g18380-like n=1 Tax=Erigeron canadensis TaxID=72917 RepID=UPI001CB951B3|nr:F-box protein At4g18380-like [Erigeron canadensis]